MIAISTVFTFISILSELPTLVMTAEQVFASEGTGADKTNFVLQTLLPVLGGFISDPDKARITTTINAIVAVYNSIGLFKKTPTAVIQPVSLTPTTVAL